MKNIDMFHLSKRGSPGNPSNKYLMAMQKVLLSCPLVTQIKMVSLILNIWIKTATELF